MKAFLYNNSDECVESVIQKLGNEIVIATPLGLGKPIQVLNAFYNYAKKNSQIQLKIITALSFLKPNPKHELEKRFAEPILERLYNNYVDLAYEVDRRLRKLPKNVQIIEFYFSPGAYIHNNTAQQDYISSNYTHIIRDTLAYNVNVIAQLICQTENTEKFSLSCNADLTPDFLREFKKFAPSRPKPLLIGELNSNLPYMYGECAEMDKNLFDAVVDTPNPNNLFAIPRPSISEQDFMIGLYGSVLVKDDGCLQVGIGNLNEALIYNLIVRHKNNEAYLRLLDEMKIQEKFGAVIESVGQTTVFQKGLFASTEILVDGIVDLYKNEILTKKVYDDFVLQKLLTENQISEVITGRTVELLLEHKRISPKLTKEDFEYLQYYGIFKEAPNMHYNDECIFFSSENKVFANLNNVQNRAIIFEKCLGHQLKNGRLVHAGFFVGSQNLYSFLKNLNETDRRKFDMHGVKKINQMYHIENLATLQRMNARFINSSMKVTLLGSVVSDTLENAQVISGVGGQYNFVAMAQELEGARSIINCRSTYVQNGKVDSNIVWEYGETTIPRFLRDIVITEYGIADCRSKTDTEVMKALLNVADSRFQEKLLQQAKRFGKIQDSYEIPEKYRNNFPETIVTLLKKNSKDSIYKRHPFGTELTNEEIQCEKSFYYLKTLSRREILMLFLKGLFIPNKSFEKVLKRMKLDQPKNMHDYFYRAILKSAVLMTI